MFRKILVPTDGSSLSTRGAAYAIKLARANRARVIALHVIPMFTPASYSDGIVPYAELYSSEDYRKATEAAARRMLARVKTRAAAAKVPCETVHVTTAEGAWKAIIDEARRRKCDLIVMASHGRSGIKGLLLGSETTKVLAHSKVPVLVTR
jgi:nucleotide-binding universal stress UspA family protein